MLIAPTLRQSAMLADLSDEQVRTLLAMLTCVTANGVLHASSSDLAAALTLAPRLAERRLISLAHARVRGEPVALRLSEGTPGPYTLSPTILGHIEQPTEPEPPAAPRRLASREEVYAASRAAYARPREEVERDIQQQLGHHPEESDDTPAGEARRRLRALGVTASDVEELMAAHTVDEILRQLNYLPERGARNPARFIVAAIRGTYDPPRLDRQETAATPAAVPVGEGAVSLPIPPQAEEGEYDK